jgi:hypothetical protein
MSVPNNLFMYANYIRHTYTNGFLATHFYQWLGRKWWQFCEETADRHIAQPLTQRLTSEWGESMSSSSNVSPGFKFQAQPSVWVSVHPASCVSVCLSVCHLTSGSGPHSSFTHVLSRRNCLLVIKSCSLHPVIQLGLVWWGAVTTRSGKLIRLKFIESSGM